MYIQREGSEWVLKTPLQSVLQFYHGVPASWRWNAKVIQDVYVSKNTETINLQTKHRKQGESRTTNHDQRILARLGDANLISEPGVFDGSATVPLTGNT